MKQVQAHIKFVMSDFHTSYLKMAWLPLCRITNELAETPKKKKKKEKKQTRKQLSA